MISEVRLNQTLVLLLVAVPLFGLIVDQPYLVTLATRVAILGMAGVGLNLALGYGGLVSFGHAAYFGAGGYVAGILAHHALNVEPIADWPILISGTTEMLIIWPLAMLFGAALAVAIGALSLRTSGVYFIMITLAFAQMLFYFAISWPSYGGEDGLPIYVRNRFPGLNTFDPLTFFCICLALLMLVLWVTSRVVGSRFGLALQAARQNAERTTSVGIDIFRIRLTAFALSGAMTALAGALYADLNRFVSPSMLSWHTSGEIMILVILGGVTRLYGPVAGAGCFVLLEQFLGGLTEHWQFWLGLMLVGVVLFAKGGIVGLLTRRPADA
ncbi:MAG: branched-chain amino acid ABC transporter permease [Paracoccaceae bacterium]|nr:branched-chain amino acid ABC transporter permease [Paracoccaceae bacterium]